MVKHRIAILPIIITILLWHGRAPKSTETLKELRWPKSDSKVTPGSHPRVTPSNSKVTRKWLKNGVRSHFWVDFRSLWGLSAWATFESLLGRFNSSCVSVELGHANFTTLLIILGGVSGRASPSCLPRPFRPDIAWNEAGHFQLQQLL